MTSHCINPLEDLRWSEFLETHPRASAFHAIAWLAALHKTYGYNPVVYTTSAPAECLRNGLVFCEIDSLITGRRLVSLPFSDHCEPLVDQPDEFHALLETLQRQRAEKRWRYIEIRPMNMFDLSGSLFKNTETYCFHHLDLNAELDAIFSGFHKNSIQRKIRRAEREGLTEEVGRSNRLLDIFYRLQLLTRRRHQLPPQPLSWFRNLIEFFGESLEIRVAFKERQPIAGILTVRHKTTLVYKYGCSDLRFHNLGGMHLLLWRAIQDAKKCGLQILDLGRSDQDNLGLVTFKERWNAKRSTSTYARFPAGASQPLSTGWRLKTAKRIFEYVPDALLSAVGTLFYKHIG
jgi:hypothetical protein